MVYMISYGCGKVHIWVTGMEIYTGENQGALEGCGGGQWGGGGGNPGVMGAPGSLREAGEERAGEGIPKVAEAGGNKIFSQHCASLSQ